MNIDGRKQPSHGVKLVDGVGQYRVFTTVCTKDRRKILATNDFHTSFLIPKESSTTWTIESYVILPDHLHLILTNQNPLPYDLKNWVRWMKSICTKSWPTRPEGKIWQQGYWDTRIRNDRHHAEITDYMRQNPVTKNLTPSPQTWPYQGGLFGK